MDSEPVDFITSKKFEINRTFDKYFRKLNYDKVIDCLETIIKMLELVMKDPSKRMFKKSSNTLKKNVLSLKGGEELLIVIGFKIIVHEFEEKYKLEDSKEINDSLNDLVLHIKHLQEKTRKWKESGKTKNDDKEYYENLR